MIWPAQNRKPAKQSDREMLIAELHRIRDNLVDEVRGRFAAVNEVAGNFGTTLERLHAVAESFDARLDDLEKRLAAVERLRD